MSDTGPQWRVGDEAWVKITIDDFSPSKICALCHTEVFESQTLIIPVENLHRLASPCSGQDSPTQGDLADALESVAYIALESPSGR